MEEWNLIIRMNEIIDIIVPTKIQISRDPVDTNTIVYKNFCVQLFELL